MEATWQTDQVPDRHRDPTVTVRPHEHVKEAATDELAKHGWTVSDALIAALSWILSDPTRALAQLARFKPPPKPKGRPPTKRDAEETP